MAKKKHKKKTAKSRSEKTSRRPEIRAAVLSFFVVFNVLAAIPSPGHVTQHKLSTPTNQAELKRWVGILADFGIETTAPELGDWYVRFAGDFERARAWVVRPLSEWMHYTQTSQGWRLFGMPDERPFALSVTAKTPQGDRLLYLSGAPEHDWQAGRLQFRRIRALYNPGSLHAPTTYSAFAKQLALEAFEEVPSATEVVVSLNQSRTTLPHEPKDERVDVRYLQSFPRSILP